jgi:hypothetical protein
MKNETLFEYLTNLKIENGGFDNESWGLAEQSNQNGF